MLLVELFCDVDRSLFRVFWFPIIFSLLSITVRIFIVLERQRNSFLLVKLGQVASEADQHVLEMRFRCAWMHETNTRPGFCLGQRVPNAAPASAAFSICIFDGALRSLLEKGPSALVEDLAIGFLRLLGYGFHAFG
jgi:hypothetical protein